MASAFDLTYDSSTPREVRAQGTAIRFDDGIPSPESATYAYDVLDHHHAFHAFLNGLPAVSCWALRQGLLAAGVADNDVLIFSELMDSSSLFLMGDCDTVLFVSFLDLSAGPLVVEVPPGSVGVINDMWQRWVTDFGFAGADRGSGGAYLLVPPAYDGPLPEGGLFVRRSRTDRVVMLGRRLFDGSDPAPAAAQVRRHLKLYPYVPGGFGSSLAGYLEGRGPLAAPGPAVEPRFVEGTGRTLNTLPPTDGRFWTMLDAAVQAEPPGALDPDVAGPIAAIGVEHGRPFQPDGRMRTILADELAVANACVRTVAVLPRGSEDLQYYPEDGSHWISPVLTGGHDFTAPPQTRDHDGGPGSGARRVNARASYFYMATGISPSLGAHLPGVGSQFLAAFLDANGIRFDGSRTYRLTLPAPVPTPRLWSVTAYDNQTRSMLVTAQRHPRAGSQPFPTPAAEPGPDGSIEIWFSPLLPHGAPEGNWIQTRPGRGWFCVLRVYSPEPAFFERTWRPGEVEAIA